MSVAFSALFLASLFAGVAAPHFPIRTLFHELTRCADGKLIQSAPWTKRPSAWRDQNALWNTGTEERIDPGTPQFETYHAHYDPVHHAVLIAQVGNEYGDTVYALTPKPYPFPQADLSKALPIVGLQLGESLRQVEREFGSGYRRDACGLEQHYYGVDTQYKGSNMLVAFILTFQHERLAKFIWLSLEG